MSSAANPLPRRRSLRRLFPPRAPSAPPPASAPSTSSPRRSFLAKPPSRRLRPSRRDRPTPPPPKPKPLPPLDTAASSVSDVSTHSAPPSRLHFQPVGEHDVPDAPHLPHVADPTALLLLHEELRAVREANALADQRLAYHRRQLSTARAKLADVDLARVEAVKERDAARAKVASLEQQLLAFRKALVSPPLAPAPAPDADPLHNTRLAERAKRTSLSHAPSVAPSHAAFVRARSMGNVHEKRSMPRAPSPGRASSQVAGGRVGGDGGRGAAMRRSLLKRSFVAHVHSKKYRGARAAWDGFLGGGEGVTPEVFARAVRGLAIAADAKDRDLDALREDVCGAQVGDTGVVTWDMFAEFYKRTKHAST